MRVSNSERLAVTIVGVALATAGCSAEHGSNQPQPTSIETTDDGLSSSTVTVPSSSTVPGSQEFLTLPDNPALSFVEAHPKDINAGTLRFLGSQPTTRWIYEAKPNMLRTVQGTVNDAKAQNKVASIALYIASDRDCGGFSSGGVANEKLYDSFVSEVADEMGQVRAIVDIEPDAASRLDLPGQTDKSCESPTQQAVTKAEILDAEHLLSKDKNANLYIDAGNPSWRSPKDMAAILQTLDLNAIRGFWVNMSNYQTDAQNKVYADAINGLLDKDKHYVQDTSRNGNGQPAGYSFCNPGNFSVATGHVPSMETGVANEDAEVWGNISGGSDGNGAGCINESFPAGSNCPPIGPAGSWNQCVAVAQETKAKQLGSNG